MSVIFSEWSIRYFEDVVEFEDEFGDFVFVGLDFGQEAVDGHLLFGRDFKII